MASLDWKGLTVPHLFLWCFSRWLYDLSVEKVKSIRRKQSGSIQIMRYIYRVIKKSLCTSWLQYRKLQVMFKVSPASLQTFIDMPNCVLEDCVQYSTVHIQNVFCDGHLQIISCVGIVRIHRVRCTETSWSLCIIYHFENGIWNAVQRAARSVRAMQSKCMDNLKVYNFRLVKEMNNNLAWGLYDYIFSKWGYNLL
jgi:hypothetical protein